MHKKRLKFEKIEPTKLGFSSFEGDVQIQRSKKLSAPKIRILNY